MVTKLPQPTAHYQSKDLSKVAGHETIVAVHHRSGRNRVWRYATAQGRPVPFAVLVLALLLGRFIMPAALYADAHTAKSVQTAASELAAQLLETVATGSSVALRPLRLDVSGLPDRVSDRLTDALQLALFETAGGRVTLKTRDLETVYNALEELYDSDIELLLLRAQVDVEIVCTASPATDSVHLLCKGLALEEATEVAMGQADFPLSREPVGLEFAIADLTERVVRGAPRSGTLDGVMIYDQLTGGKTELSNYLASLLEASVVESMEQRQRDEAGAERAEAVLATARERVEGLPRYRVQGSLWRLDAEQVRLQLRLLPSEGRRPLLATGADIAVVSLPSGLSATPTHSHSDAGRMYEARASAVVSTRLDRRAAERGARNLARARVVASALGLPAPTVEEVTTESDAVAVLENMLNEGIPVDERWFPVNLDLAGTDEERVAVGLAARVAPIGGMYRPRVSASLSNRIFRARHPITIEIRSEESAYLGVFAWGADNRVVRLYPEPGRPLRIAGGEVLVLPRPGEGRIVSEPLRSPDNREDHEALIVIAAADSADFSTLAPTVGARLSDTQARAVPGGDFLAALGSAGIGQVTVIVLPYQVHR